MSQRYWNHLSLSHLSQVFVPKNLRRAIYAEPFTPDQTLELEQPCINPHMRSNTRYIAQHNDRRPF